MKAIMTMVDGINKQDFKAMKKPWSFLGKVLVKKKQLRQQFEPFHTKFGDIYIDTVTYTSEYEYTAKVKSANVPEQRMFLRFIFNKKGKVEGFSFAYPPLIYPKNKTHNVTDYQAFAAKVDTLIKRKYLKSKTKPFNGSIAVIDNGRDVYVRHIGYADMDAKTTINDNTLYELASCSKQFTAAAIMLLERQGKLKVSDTIRMYIPDFPYKNITIDNLLSHTSGLPGYEEMLDKVWDKSKFATNYDVLELFKQRKPKVYFKPNEQFMYSNTGYMLLSVIIEKASGMSYAQYLDAAIFKPLGMKHTRVYNTRRAKGEKIENYAYGYVYSSEKKKYVLPDSTKENNYVIYMDPITGDGTVNSCIEDLTKWEKGLLTNSVIEKKYLDIAYTDHKLKNGQKTGYGYGLFLDNEPGTEPIVYHTGGWPGYVCIIMRFIDQRKAIVVLCNNDNSNFTKLTDDIAALLLGQN